MERPPADHPPALAESLRARVQALHRTAEHSGIVADILRSRASRHGYGLLLRNLLPAYHAMEQGLERHRRRPALRHLAIPGLYRAAAIESDLRALHGPGWTALPLLPEGSAYADRVEAAADGDGSRLIAHAYTRYLGDLSGGQTIQRLLARSLDIPSEALSLYAFPAIGEPEAFKTAYRQAINEAAALLDDPAAVIEEAAAAFAHNIAVSVAVQNVEAEAASVRC